MKKLYLVLLFMVYGAYANSYTINTIDMHRLIKIVFLDFTRCYHDDLYRIINTRTDPDKIKKLIHKYVNLYGRKYARNFLQELAKDCGCKTEIEINQFVKDSKELIKALLPDVVLAWVRTYITYPVALNEITAK